MLGPLLALASAAALSAANLGIVPASRRLGTIAALVWSQGIGAIAGCIAALVVDGPLPAIDGSAAWQVLAAGVSSLLAYGGLFESLRRGRLSVVAPIVSSWCLVSVACGVTLLGERVGAAGGAGIALVVLGNLAIAWRQKTDPDAGAARPLAAVVAAS